MNPPLLPAPCLPAKSRRLARQGLVNVYRKPLLAVFAALLGGYLACVPAPLAVGPRVWLCSGVAGLLLVLAGAVLRVFAILSIGGRKDREIVTTELYSVTRNPLYFGSFLMALGFGLAPARPEFLWFVLAAFAAVFYPMMRNEAKDLRARFPDYADYERRVPLFFPRFRLWQERRHLEIDFRLARRTLMDALAAVLVLPLLMWLGRLAG